MRVDPEPTLTAADPGTGYRLSATTLDQGRP